MRHYTQSITRLILAVVLIAVLIALSATPKEAQASGFDCYHHTTTDWVSHSRAVIAVYYPRHSSWSWSPRYHWQHKHWYYIYVFDHHKVVYKGWQQVNCSG